MFQAGGTWGHACRRRPQALSQGEGHRETGSRLDLLLIVRSSSPKPGEPKPQRLSTWALLQLGPDGVTTTELLGFALAMTLLGTDDVALFERVEEVVP
jgi:hypothetical protein